MAKKYPWVEKAKDGSDDAHCSLCRQNITPGLTNLDKQQSTKGKLIFYLEIRRYHLFPPRKMNAQEIELHLAIGITCHSSIMAVDHLSEIVVQHGKESKLEKIKLHRTKCSLVIKNVIFPALHKDFCTDMVGQKCCVILDESTDVSCTKLLCVVFRNYSKSEKRIVTSFLNLLPTVKATGKDLFEAQKNCQEQSGMSLNNCIGHASDGASVMVEEHDSAWARNKAASPNVF